MLNKILSQFYERDPRQLIEEVKLFPNEADLWSTTGTITNSAGNLVLHLIGGMNHHIGANIARTSYLRQRDLEFSQKAVPRTELVAGLEALIALINQTLDKLTLADLEAENPAFFDQFSLQNQFENCMRLSIGLPLSEEIRQKLNYWAFWPQPCNIRSNEFSQFFR